ncbi:MAG: diaminopimelate epimerase [Microthrixaceae bacterium]|nr:diaminopimelate epimerase [Microthrixaceae bacterium]
MTATSGIRLTKHHGLGNDFLVALVPQPEDVPIDADLARHVCDRRRGIGADGLLYGIATDGSEAEVPDLQMVLLNSDGSRAEISGNGLRCLGQAVLRSRGVRKGELSVATDAGIRDLVGEPTDDPATDLLTASMGVVAPGPAVPSLPLDVLDAVGLDVGNPHLVLRVGSLAGIHPAELGPVIEAQVPGGVNVHFLVAEAPDAIRLLHWERGAGVTEACGSGATASAFAARRWGLVGDEVTVRMPGGDVVVLLEGDTAALRGTATFVGEVTLA